MENELGRCRVEARHQMQVAFQWLAAIGMERNPDIAPQGAEFCHKVRQERMQGRFSACKVNENSPVTVIISDNLTTGMTGGQDSQGTGKLEEICLGLGVDPAHLHTIDSHPRNVDAMTALFRDEIAYEGLSVIISRRECIQTARRH